MYRIYIAGKRANNKKYESYEAARSAARKILRKLGATDKNGFHNPCFYQFDVTLRRVA